MSTLKPSVDPYTTPAASDMTLNDKPYELSAITLEAEDTAGSSDLADSERRKSSDANDQGTKETALDTVQRVRTEDQPVEYPSSWKLAVIVFSLCLSILCMALDNTIIATAIPRITDQFAGSIEDVGWFGSAYLLTACAFQLFYGKLYSSFSVKWVYLSAFTIFEIGSVICGAAPNANALIVGRAVAGLGAAGVFNGAMLIIASTAPLEKRPLYTGLIGGMYGIASVAGPLLGGVFTDSYLTWRWCFYINLPLGAVTLIFISVFFKSPPRDEAIVALPWKEKLALMDIEGTIIFVPAIVCCLLALQWGGSKYDWSNGRIIGLFVVFGVLLAAFITLQWYKGDRATVPFRILRNRSIGACAFFAACIGGSFFSIIYYVPIWFHAIQGVTAVESGIRNLPLVLSVTVFSIIAGIATTIFGYYTPWIYLSVVLCSLGAGLISTWHLTTGIGMWLGYQIIFGAGVGSGIQQPMMAVQVCLDKKDIAIGTSVVIFFQTFGGALFIAVAENIFLNKIYSNMALYAPDFDATTVAITGATELRGVVPAQYLPAVLMAYNKSLDETFYVAVATAALSVFGAAFVQWRSVKGKKIEMGGGA